MKKPILMITAVCAAACCLGACSFSSCGDDDAGVSDVNAINAMLNSNYSQINLTVTDAFDEDIELVSAYEIKYSNDGVTVKYSLERFAEISLDAPADIITTVTGEAVIKNGAVISGSLDVSGTLPDGLEFKEEYFENAELTGAYLKADVKNASSFMGTTITCSDMKVYVTFSSNKIDTIEITYVKSDGNSVEFKYEFQQ